MTKYFAVAAMSISLLTAALPAFAFLPFGGRIVAEIPCKNGVLLALSPPTPGFYLLPPPPAARVYAFFLPIIPNWVLGLAVPGGVCACPSPHCEIAAVAGAIGGLALAGPVGAVIGAAVGIGATTLPAQATIIMVGTSGGG